MISYNNGAAWSLLKAPAKDINGRSYNCGEHCELHLHSYTSRSRVKNEISDAGAIGLLVGVGNVGEALGSYESSNVYVTRDAGVTWSEVATGPHLFEFGDHGGRRQQQID
jgi:hypothetical protein